MKFSARGCLILAPLVLAGCTVTQGSGPAAAQKPTAASEAGVAHPDLWPRYRWPVPTDPVIEAKIAGLIGRMTLEEKIGQLVQGDICCTTPADVRQYHLGSILAGGSSGPRGNDFAPAKDWLELADEYWSASVDKSGGGVGVPMIWGVDAVHGHANIIGATVFPHNIGLGAAHDPALIERIGAVTATEIRVTGQEWTFAPTVTVPQDYRWGRAYEGYSADPKLVSSYVGAMIRGLQGPAEAADMLGRGKVLASTKHFLADGGTDQGVDQGDAKISEAELRDVHGAPYGPAVENGVGTVMVSFSSWQGRKMTGNRSLLTGVLRDRMNFGGFTVSDWNAHGQVEGCTNSACPQALLAGVDMYMAPDTWKPVWENLLAEAKAGRIPMARIDEAVGRILRVKYRMGLMEAAAPSRRALSGQWSLLGSPEHRDVAREAVRKSLVLLKNQGVLPLKPGGHLLVAGDGADSVAKASGGWTITWQGTGTTNANFPGATSIWTGLQTSFAAAGGTSELSPDGSFAKRPNVAVVVFGENPYAEFQGDRKTLRLDPELSKPIETMRRLKSQGIPVVAVMLTGRPLYANPAINLADAFVVAWLPGSEGAGLADVMVGDRAGRARFDFSGTLPAPWPRTGTMADGVQWPIGFGLNYASLRTHWFNLPEIADVDSGGDARLLFSNGVPAPGWSLRVAEGAGASPTRITSVPAMALNGRLAVSGSDFRVQEGARRFAIAGGPAEVALDTIEPVDLSREVNADVMLLVSLRVWEAPVSATLGVRCAGATCAAGTALKLAPGAGYVRYGIPLKCFAGKGADMAHVTAPLVLTTQGKTNYAIGEVRFGTDAEVILPCN
jgi:beta-glucosidase